METSLSKAIVIVGYKRPEELRRLLKSISYAYTDKKFDLILSIDFSEIQEELIRIFNEFSWEYGEKIVIKRKKHLGLRKHIIECGNLTDSYDYIIVLEEDLIVSKEFLDYSSKAVDFYQNQKQISCISLYSYRTKEIDKQPFFPIHFGHDNYFLQICPSWGQIWTKSQWRSFKKWYEKYQEETGSNVSLNSLPGYIKKWPKSSWKKYFTAFMIEEKKYSAIPRIGLSTNPGSEGQNHSSIFDLFNIQLLNGSKHWNFSTFEEGIFYNAKFEFTKKNTLGLISGSFDKKLISESSETQSKNFFRKFPYSAKTFFKILLLALRNDLNKLKIKLLKKL